jgi:hypothetical protein
LEEISNYWSLAMIRIKWTMEFMKLFGFIALGTIGWNNFGILGFFGFGLIGSGLMFFIYTFFNAAIAELKFDKEVQKELKAKKVLIFKDNGWHYEKD